MDERTKAAEAAPTNSTITNLFQTDNIFGQEFAKIKEQLAKEKSTYPLLEVQAMNGVLAEARKMPKRKELIRGLMFEGELFVLFGRPGSGKTLLAMKWASDIAARGLYVLYLDMELSGYSLLNRYGDMDFPPTFFRAAINPQGDVPEDYYGEVFAEIEAIIREYGINVLVVDNITALSPDNNKVEVANVLMNKFLIFKRKYKLSLIILCHSPKNKIGVPLGITSVAGGMGIANLADDVVGLGRGNGGVTYLKQVKHRDGALAYDEDNCLLFDIRAEGGRVEMTAVGSAPEYELLRQETADDKAAKREQAKELAGQGWTQRQIATELGVSPSMVNKYLKKK